MGPVPTDSPLRVAAWQFDVRRESPEANLAAVLRGLELAAEVGARLLCLPEMWPTSFPVAAGPFGASQALTRALAHTEAAWAQAGERAKELGLALVGSGFGPPGPGGLPTNRLRWIVNGVQRAAYDKLHLFGPTGEPLAFCAGEEPPEGLSIDGLSAAGIVCYDLRFPALIESLLLDGIELLVVPAQWPSERAAHLRALLIGRAVELQSFVVGVNRTGSEALGRRGRRLGFAGGSAIVAPDGALLACAGEEQTLIWADLEPGRLAQVRAEVPLRRDLRAGAYARWRALRPDA